MAEGGGCILADIQLTSYDALAGDPNLSRLTDLLLIDPDGAGGTLPVLYGTNRFDGRIWAWEIGSGAPVLIDSSLHIRADAAGAVAELLQIEGALGPSVLSGGGGAGIFAEWGLSSTGQLGPANAFPPTSVFTSDLTQMISLSLSNGQAMVFGALSAGGGIGAMQLGADGSFQSAQRVSGTTSGDYAALAHLEAGGVQHLYAARSDTDEIEHFTLSSVGELSLQATYGPDASVFLGQASQMTTAEIAGEEYLIVADAGASSLTVLAVQPNGALSVADHLRDDGVTTRFQNVTKIEVVSHGDQVFVVAAGSDDGVSVFQLLPSGRLVHMASRGDDFSSGLQNVSAVEAVSTATGVRIFVASNVESGLTVLEFDSGPAGQLLFAPQTGGQVTGGSTADTLIGRDQNDVLSGAGGDDVLIDGAGSDVMTGGAGRDIFVMSWDQQSDRITDFTLGEDVIDLSGWVYLYWLNNVDMTPTALGITLSYQGETLVIETANQTSLTVEDITPSLVLSPNRLLPDWDEILLNGFTSADEFPMADTFQGALGNDRYRIDHPEDEIVGEIGYSLGGGIDTVEAWISWNLIPNVEILRLQGTDDLNGGGTWAPEALVGQAGNNILDGSRGNDAITAKAGDDTLIGGRGADKLVGDAGADVFLFREVEDSPAGPATRDFINGFENGSDLIDLSAIDADITTASDDSFVFIDNAAFSGTAGELRHFTWGGNNFNIVEADIDGDAAADFQVFVNLTPAMTTDDFIF